MTLAHLKKDLNPHFYAIKIDSFIPHFLRSLIRKIFAFGALLSFVASFFELPFSFTEFISADGLFFILVFFYLILFFLECFYRSMKNEGIKSRIKDRVLDTGTYKEFALSKFVFEIDEIDATKILFEHPIGISILERTGIEKHEITQFIHSNRVPIVASSLVIDSEDYELSALISSFYEADKSIQSFLNAHSINKEEFMGAVKMISESEEKNRRENRFWSRENLGAIPSIGTSWAYGISTDLGRFGLNFANSISIKNMEADGNYREREVNLLEGILERSLEANAIIVDDDESVARDILARLLKKIKLGIAFPNIEHKNIVELDWNALIANFKEKNELQKEIIKILNQAKNAGNIILYIRDLPGFVISLNNSGINFPSLASPYLASSLLQIVAHSSNSDFHYFIETNASLLERFERIVPDEIGPKASMSPIIEKSLVLEKEHKIIFSFGALEKIAISADRYIPTGEMPSKALDLLIAIIPWAMEKNIKIIKEQDVAIFITEKTGITTGEMKAEEIEKITHLEETLHQRVIGQNIAINAIASAMRRARSGVIKPNRPIASFLFLGPTGVGKTETTKTLAHSFFGSEEKMIRLDMSEYNGADAMSRLIGSFAENKSGVLASKVRDNSYGVLLLDEFEKATRDVHDLFLQILDEGIFSDTFGKKVNCRNLIIIATSNAGSSLIWDSLKAGKDLTADQPIIIDQIIKDRVFKPELINRFDGVILFAPLNKEELKKIAFLETNKLIKRIKEQEIEVVINDDVLEFLVNEASDNQFGARAINRAIQNKVEDLIARKIVSGEVKPGGKIEINASYLG